MAAGVSCCSLTGRALPDLACSARTVSVNGTDASVDELKTHQRGPRVVLRSKTPDGVRQEIYGHLCTHYAIRALVDRC
jgi:hypothetical protein